MTTIQWKPQPTPRDGSIIADSFLNLLTRGDSPISEPELLVRETAQNSWDARRTELKQSTEMTFAVKSLENDSLLRTNLKKFFSDAQQFSKIERHPNSPSVLRKLWSSIDTGTSTVLYVRDIGTHGLGGPIDASSEVPTGTIDRYVRFLLNVGQANSDLNAGGSYGLGRSVFWRMSSCQTVIVYTRFVEDGIYQSRLIGLTLGGKFSMSGKNYTGRHWWSDRPDGEPVVGEQAETMAHDLGFEVYNLEETGTSVLVLAPNVPQGTTDLAKALARSIEYHLWPKYVSVNGRFSFETMSFRVRDENQSIAVRNAVELQNTPLKGFIEAFELLRRQTNSSGPFDYSRLLEHNFMSPLEDLRKMGRLSIKRLVRVSMPIRPNSQQDDEISQSLESVVQARIDTLENSVALMRTPELVVSYKPIPSNDPEVSLVGVFKSTDPTNTWFRMSETSTHTEWSKTVPPERDPNIPNRIHPARRLVDIFHKNLEKQVNLWFPPEVVASPPIGRSKLRLEQLASNFGQLLTDLTRGRGNGIFDNGDAPNPIPPVPPERVKKRSKGTVSVEPAELLEIGGELVNQWTLTFTSHAPVKVDVELFELMDTSKIEAVSVAKGGLPALTYVEGQIFKTLISKSAPTVKSTTDSKISKRFDHGLSDENETSYSIQALSDEKNDLDSVHGTLTVRAVFEEGTTAVLVVNLLDPLKVEGAS